MTHHFAAANVWLAVALALLIGEWGPGESYNLFGYGRIEPPLYWGAVAAALGAAGFCAQRWLGVRRAPGGPEGGPPPVVFFALAQAWLVVGLVLLLGMHGQTSNVYRLFGYGRIEPAVYWGVLTGALGAAGFCLLRWNRTRSVGGPAAVQPTAGRDLARVGLALFVALGVYAASSMAEESNLLRNPEEAATVGGVVLLYLTITVALARKAFRPPAPGTGSPAGPATPRKRSAGMSEGMWAGVIMVGVSAVGLLVVIGIGSVRGTGGGFPVWFTCLLAVGLLGAMVLLAAVLTGRPAPERPAGPAHRRRAPDATTMLLRTLGAMGIVGMVAGFVLFFMPPPGPAWPPSAFVMLGVLACGVAIAVCLLVIPPARRPGPAADRPRCPTCGEPIADGSPAGLCPRCLLRAGVPATPNSSPTLAFVESVTAPPVEDVRKLFPHLAVERLISQGGMGAVYLARQPALDRPVALKLIRRRADDPTFVERFTREARAMARLSHPNVVAVYESGEAGGLPYLVLEYVDGPTLRDAMRQKALGPAAALAVVRQVCDALEYAHRHGVVHRDIKPENILLKRTEDREQKTDDRGQKTEDREEKTKDRDQRAEVSGQTAAEITVLCPLSSVLCAKITDFGLAKVADPNGVSLTGTWQAMGTPHYMAPEQWERPAEVDHRADIYALGVVLYELLTGELPLGRFDPPSRKVEVDVRVDEVVLRALAKEPERRYQRAREVGTDLDHIRPKPGA